MEEKAKKTAIFCFLQKMAGWTGLEPATFRVTGGRSIQAELPPHNNKNPNKDFPLNGAPDVALCEVWLPGQGSNLRPND